MYYLLFILFLCLCCFFISRNRFVKSTGLPTWLLSGIFLLKAVVSIVVGYMTRNVISDSWYYNRASQDEYNLLVTQPGQFFYDLIRPGYMTWHDLPENLVIKTVAVLDIFSRGNYYINSLFFAMAAFFGSIALYKVFKEVYASAKWDIVVGCFLLPSLLVFTGTIHKDAIVFCLLAFFCHTFYFSLRDKISFKRILILLITAFFITIIRSYVMIALLPCLLAWVIAAKTKISPWVAFAGTYVISILILLLIQLASPGSTPLKMISSRQAEFFKLETAKSQIATDTIYPTLQSFAKNSPQALSHTLMQPYLFQFSAIPVIQLFALEMHIYMLFFLLMLLFYKRSACDPFAAFSIFFALTIFLIIGYIVPNIGAISRYRSIFLPFLITPLLCHINWQKIKTKLHINF